MIAQWGRACFMSTELLGCIPSPHHKIRQAVTGLTPNPVVA